MPQKQSKMVRKGTYILVFNLPEIDVNIGALGLLHFSEGTYCYVGSAMNGLDQRINRHLSMEKKIHWHIDRLTMICTKMSAYESALGQTECDLSEFVLKCGGKRVAKGFGCSDCKCETHLFILDAEIKRKLCSDAGLTLHSQRYEAE